MKWSTLEMKLSPVMAFLLFAAAMWLLNRALPGADLPESIRLALLSPFLVVAAAVGGAAVLSFRKARTTVNPWRPENASVLVRSGIFSYSRNPMYLALLLALIGWGLFLANPFSLAFTVLFVVFLNRSQIQPEERTLRKVFGADFEQYCREVRRWI